MSQTSLGSAVFRFSLLRASAELQEIGFFRFSGGFLSDNGKKINIFLAWYGKSGGCSGIGPTITATGNKEPSPWK
jgi:hypothetical protein